jgi:hypothetical protein
MQASGADTPGPRPALKVPFVTEHAQQDQEPLSGGVTVRFRSTVEARGDVTSDGPRVGAPAAPSGERNRGARTLVVGC